MEKIEIIEKMYTIITSEELKSSGRVRQEDFTRERKIGFIEIILLIMNMLKRSIQIEIDEFTEKFTSKEIPTYTKQSFSESRQKIKPEVFKVLNKEFLKLYYSTSYKKYKKYRLLGIDGSKIQIPNSADTRKTFGSITNNHDHFETAQALTSTLYDIENDIIISSVLEHCYSNERNLAEKNIDEMLEIVENDVENLILFDRGYPSFEMITYLEQRQQKYLMRVKSNSFKEFHSTTSDDEVVSVTITPTRKKHLKQQGFIVETGTKIIVRVIKLTLPSGEEEILITNLTDAEVPYSEFKDLYFRRWGIETKYDELKNRFEIENFSGKSTTVVRQDFFAASFLSNIASIIEEDAANIYNAKDNSKKNTSTE